MLISEKIVISAFLGIIFYVYARQIFLIVGAIAAKIDRKRDPVKLFSNSAIVIHILSILGIVCFLYGYFIEPYQLKVNQFEISSSKLKEANLRIVHISDLHCDRKIRNETNLIDIVNSLEADLIVFTGDALNTLKAKENFQNTLSKLKANISKLAVSGNWDVYVLDLNIIELFKGTGFKVLEEECFSFAKGEDKFSLCGLGYDRYFQIDKVSKKVNPEDFNIFLFHSPNLIEKLGATDFDLYLAGHTHGGQVALPFYGAMVTFSKYGKKYESGKYTVNKMTIYINKGVGMEGGLIPRVRFLSQPEIAVFDITSR